MVKNLRLLRESHKLSQERLAKLTGISKSRIYTYETSNREPDIEGLIILSEFFGVTIDYLVGRENDFYSPKSVGILGLEKFGERVQGFRLQRGITREELAAKVGITDTYLSMVESGTKVPGLETCLKLLNALEASADIAFMDSLVSGSTQKASYLNSKLEEISAEDRQTVLTAVEGLIEAFKRRLKSNNAKQRLAEPPQTTTDSQTIDSNPGPVPES